MPTKLTEYLKVRLDDGATIQIEAVQFGGEQKVANFLPGFRPLIESISSVSASVKGAIETCRPGKAVVEFGIEIGVEAGQLTAILAKGTGKANLKVTLEWSH